MIVPVAQPGDAAEVRRRATALAQTLGFGETAAGKVAIVATELATNIAKHARSGEVVIAPYGRADDGAADGVELLAIDSGPGMADLARCLEDGYSTAGSPGTGLGAIQRLSDLVSIFSQPRQGTVLMARLGRGARGAVPPPPGFETGAVAANCPGESVCGDDWSVLASARACRLLVADGSGHGPDAHRAAALAVEIFRRDAALGPAAVVEGLHRGLAATRGASVGVAVIDLDDGTVRFSGLGNIAGALIEDDRTRHMVSLGGTAGHTRPSVKEFGYPFAAAEPIVVLHSDGLSARWNIAAYPGLTRLHPGVIAGVLYRDHRRGRDDATVVVVRPARGSARR